MKEADEIELERTHLHALELRRSHEVGYRAKATTDGERKLRDVWITQIEKEIAEERKFLGLPPEEKLPEMSVDDILAELEDDDAPAGPRGP